MLAVNRRTNWDELWIYFTIVVGGRPDRGSLLVQKHLPLVSNRIHLRIELDLVLVHAAARFDVQFYVVASHGYLEGLQGVGIRVYFETTVVKLPTFVPSDPFLTIAGVEVDVPEAVGGGDGVVGVLPTWLPAVGGVDDVARPLAKAAICAGERALPGPAAVVGRSGGGETAPTEFTYI